MESIAEDMLLNIDEADGDQSDFEESLGKHLLLTTIFNTIQ